MRVPREARVRGFFKRDRKSQDESKSEKYWSSSYLRASDEHADSSRGLKLVVARALHYSSSMACAFRCLAEASTLGGFCSKHAGCESKGSPDRAALRRYEAFLCRVGRGEPRCSRQYCWGEVMPTSIREDTGPLCAEHYHLACFPLSKRQRKHAGEIGLRGLGVSRRHPLLPRSERRHRKFRHATYWSTHLHRLLSFRLRDLLLEDLWVLVEAYCLEQTVQGACSPLTPLFDS